MQRKTLKLLNTTTTTKEFIKLLNKRI